MKPKKINKSYQHKIVEIPFDQNKLNNFPTERGIGHVLSENEMNEKIFDLREELKQCLYDIAHSEILTEHQQKILFMRLMGKTQNEIASHLKITQSAVHKSLYGNIDYKNNKKRYGGIMKKMKKVCKNNEGIQNILKKIEDAKNGTD